jgi:hypothetical protein
MLGGQSERPTEGLEVSCSVSNEGFIGSSLISSQLFSDSLGRLATWVSA